MALQILLVTNLGKVRREVLQGRSYLVAPMTMIVPGVLPGSEGPLYYPESEVAADPSIWNGMPLVVGHPMDDSGSYVSARQPDILNKYGIGYVFNSAYVDDKLASEAWFDEELTRAYDANLPDGEKIIPKLEAGLPIELSTGLFTLNEDKPGTDPRTGRQYDAVARGYKADHLAVLTGEVGACSIRDGCGILVNVAKGQVGILESKTNQVPVNLPAGETEMKKTLITWLTANCSCWKGKEKTLETLSEEELKLLKNQNVALRVVNSAKKGLLKKTVQNAGATDEEVAPGVDIAALAEFLGVQTDAASDPVGFIKELQSKVNEIQQKLSAGPAEDAVDKGADDATETPAEPAVSSAEEPKKPATNQKKLSGREYLAQMPDELKPIWNASVRSYKEKKAQVINRLTAHLKGQAKTDMAGRLGKKNLDELEELAALLPKQPAANGKTRAMHPDDDDDPFTAVDLPNWGGQDNSPSFDGAGGGGDPTVNSGNGDLDTPLDIPTMDYSTKTGYAE